MDIWSAIRKMHQISCISYEIASKRAIYDRLYIRRALANKTNVRIDTFVRIAQAFGFELYISDANQSVAIRSIRTTGSNPLAIQPDNALTYIKNHSQVKPSDISRAVYRSMDWLETSASYNARPNAPLFFDTVVAAKMSAVLKGYGTTIDLTNEQDISTDSSNLEVITSRQVSQPAASIPIINRHQVSNSSRRPSPSHSTNTKQESTSQWAQLRGRNSLSSLHKQPSKQNQSEARRHLAAYAARLLADVLRNDGVGQQSLDKAILTFKETSVSAYDCYSHFIKTNQPIQINRLRAQYCFSEDLTYTEIVKRINEITSSAQVISKKRGINTLCLSLGTLHWTDKRNNEYADPLLLVQVHIVEKPNENCYSIRPCNNQVFSNPLLEIRLAHKAGIRLPKFDAGAGIGTYFERINKLANPQFFCHKTSEVSLRIVPFQRAQVYQEMVAHADELLSNPLVQTIVSHSDSSVEGASVHSIKDEIPESQFLIANADANQQRAVAIAHGNHSFILRGGPGTGKSQTTANLIANSMHAGKTVLYIAEKPTALNAMYHFFQQGPLHQFFLPILDDNDNACELRTELKQMLSGKAMRPHAKTEDVLHNVWQQAFSQIDEYAHQLNDPLQPLGKSPYEVMGILWQYRKRRIQPLDCEMPFVGSVSERNLHQQLFAVKRYALLKQQASSTVPHDNWAMLNISWNAMGTNETAISTLRAVISSAQELLSLHTRVQDGLGIHVEHTRAGMQDILLAFEQDPSDTTLLTVLSKFPPDDKQSESDARVATLCETVAQRIQTLFSLDPSFTINTTPANPINNNGITQIRADVAKLFNTPHYATWLTIPNNVVDYTVTPLRTQVERYNKLRDIILQDYQEDILQLDDVFVEELLKAGRRSVIGHLFGQRAQGTRAIARYRRTNGSMSQEETLLALERLSELDQTKRQINELDALYSSVLPGLYKGVQSDIEHIIRLRNAFNEARSLLQCLDDLEDALNIQREEIRRKTELMHELSDQIRNALSQSDQAFSILSSKTCNCDLDSIDLHTLQSATTSMLHVVQERQDIEHKMHLAREECTCQGLNSFIDCIDSLASTVDSSSSINYEDVFLCTFYQKWYDTAAKTARSAMRHLDTDGQVAIIERLEETSSDRHKDNCLRLAAQLFDTARSSQMRSSQSDEVKYLVNAVANNLEAFSIKHALRYAPQTMQRLKPCIMMSPLATAAHIGSSSISFDIVIIDDAAELCTEDVLLAIGHSKQTVIVSDNYKVHSSLLSDAVCLDTLNLKNHYRSRNGFLIDFPNRMLYNNDLAIFPTCNRSGNDNGINVVLVKGKSPENPAMSASDETSYVVDAVFSHFAQYGTDRSIGVIVFDSSQKEDVIHQLALRSGSNANYAQCLKETLREPFVVTTAEDAAGLERDVIILSVGCSTEQENTGVNVTGSLLGSKGARNLGIAITRARFNTTVVTSVTSEQFNVTNDTSDGVRMLRDYLAFAEGLSKPSHKMIPYTNEHDASNDDWFVNALQAVLTKHGYDVDTHVGTSAYKVDLAVKHPKYEDWYCLGIQCDGPAYRESDSAHEREQTINSALRERGWNLFHAWSDAWFLSPTTNEQALLEAVKQSIASFQPPILCLSTVIAADIGNEDNDRSEHSSATAPSPHASATKRSPATTQKQEKQTTNPREDFSQWMKEAEIDPLPAIRHSFSIGVTNIFLATHKYDAPPNGLYGCIDDAELLSRILEQLLNDPEFAYEDRHESGRITLALQVFVKFVQSSVSADLQQPIDDEILRRLQKMSTDKQVTARKPRKAFPEQKPAIDETPQKSEPSETDESQETKLSPQTQAHERDDAAIREEEAVAVQEPQQAKAISSEGSSEDVRQAAEPKSLSEDILDQEISSLVSKNDAQALGQYEVYSLYDLNLYKRDELIELPEITNELLGRIEQAVLKKHGVEFKINGSAREIRDKRKLTHDEMLVLDKPISFLEVEPPIRRQLQRNAIDTCRKVAFTTIDEFLDCPGIDLESAYLLEELIGTMLGSRVFLGRRQGEIPLVAPRETPLRWRYPKQPSDKPSTSKGENQSLLDWVAELSSPAKEHVQALLNGFEVAGMAQKERIPISTIWSLVANAFINRPHLREDTFASLYRSYNLTLVEFCYITQQPPSTYRYLELIYTHGQKSVYSMTSDDTLPESYRERAAVCPLGAKTSPRPSLLTLELPTFNSNRDNQAARDNQRLSHQNTRISLGTRRTLVDLVDERVIDGNEYSVDYLFEAIKGNDKHIYYANQTEFESALRQAYQYDKKVSFPADGIIRFGTCNRRDQVARLYSRLGSVDSNTLAKEYQRRYGIGASVVRYWIIEIARIHNQSSEPTCPTDIKRDVSPKPSAQSTNRSQDIAQQLEFLRFELKADCCDRSLIVERFRARFPQGPSDPFDNNTLYRLGYKRRGKKLLFKSGIDPENYFETLITSHERFSKGDAGFERAVFNDPLFRRILRRKMRSFEIVEYDKDAFIRLETLCKTMPIQPEDLKGYSHAVAEAVGKAVPFTIWSLRNHMNLSFPLDALAVEGGVGNHLFETLLDIDPHVQTCSMGKTRCFIVAEGPITAGNVLECIIETTDGGMDFDDLRYHLKDSYGITIAELPLHNTVRQSSLYYDDLTECVFNSKREWEEMVERELAD